MLIRRAGAVLALVLGVAVGVPLVAAAPAQAVDPGQPVRVAIAVPITVPASSIGLIDAEALEAYTRPLGVLTRQLDAVFGRPVAIGIDPMIIASIRALGTTAPESALLWLERLGDAPNQVFPLAYADLDLTLATQAGATTLPVPTSFLLDPAIVTPVEPTDTPTPEPSDDAEDPDAPDVPSVEELLAWPYSATGIAWPREGTVIGADLPVIGDSDYTTTILSSSNIARDASASPTTEVDGQGVLVSDAGVSQALRAAATATDPSVWGDTVTALLDAITAAARAQPGDQATVFATLPRELPVTGARLAETLDALSLDGRITTIPLTLALASQPDTATVVDAPQAADRIVQARMLLSADANTEQFATIAADPSAISGPERLALLALLSASWEASLPGWPAAVTEQLTATNDLTALVQVGETSRINLLADRQTLPIPIVNGLSQPVTVIVTVDPSTPILAVEDRRVELTIEPNSQANALIPVQAVSNGTVQIQVTVSGQSGVAIGAPKSVEVVVNAGWETPIFIVLASGVVILFVGGIIRNIVRRRRPAAAAVEAGTSGGTRVTDRAGDEPDAASTVGRASVVLGAGTLVSRILGFVSAFVLSIALGITGAGADAFALANQLPNNVYAIVAGGLLGAVLVPAVVRAGLHDDGGKRFVNKIVTLGGLAFVAIAIIVTLCAPLLVRLYATSGAEGFSEAQLSLAIGFAYWCLPQVLFYALYSLFGEILNARGVFGPFTWAPAVNNVVAITGILIFIALYGGESEHVDAAGWTPAQIALLAGTATLGIAAQAFVLVFFWRRAGLGFRPDFQWRGAGLGRAGASAAWLFGMVLITQLAGIVESRVASIPSGDDDASIAALRYGWLIFMLPHSVITVSVATAYFTRMSGHARDGDLASLRTDVSAALRGILLIMVLGFVALVVLAWPFSAVFAQGPTQVAALATVLLAFLVGMIPFTVLFVLQRVFYSLDDTRTPFAFQVVQAVLYVAGALLVAAFAPDEWIAVGLALVLSIAGTIQTITAAVLLRRRLQGLGLGLVALRALWFLAAAIVAGAAGWGVLVLLGGTGDGAFPVSGPVGAIASMAVAGLVMAVVYLAVLWITRNPELRVFVTPIAARITRR